MTNPGQVECRLYQALARALVDHGIDTLFGVMGDANLFMVDSFIRDRGGRFVPASHEGNAVLMAHGHAQAHQVIGVATTTHGPGLTNTVTGLVEAVRSHTPMVLMCGDTPAGNPTNMQYINQRELIRVTGAGFVQLRTPDTALQDMATAFYRAALEQRPIVFNMPIEHQWADVRYAKCIRIVPDTRAYLPASADLDSAAGILATASRPIILAGRGAIDARGNLIRLAERVEAALATTLRANGLFAGEPYNLGIYGTLSTPVAVDEIVNSDCIVAFGASLSSFTSGGYTGRYGRMFDGKRVVQIDVNPAFLGKNYRPTVAVVGDAARTADRMLELLDEAEIPASQYRSEQLRQAIASWQLEPQMPGYVSQPAPGTVDVRHALLRLNEAIPDDRMLVTDVGRFMIQAWQAIPVESPRALIHAAAFTAVGCGAGTAIGAAVGADGPTVLICGDGGFMMNGLGELHTAVREQLDLIVIVCNDSCYGAEYMQFRARDMDPHMARSKWPDIGAVAGSLGFDSVTVHDEHGLEAAAQAINDRHGPVLIELVVDADRMQPR